MCAHQSKPPRGSPGEPVVVTKPVKVTAQKHSVSGSRRELAACETAGHDTSRPIHSTACPAGDLAAGCRGGAASAIRFQGLCGARLQGVGWLCQHRQPPRSG